MQKYILLLCLLVAVGCSDANAWLSPGIAGTSIPYTAAGECDAVSGYELFWNGDHSSSTTTACIDGGTLAGTLSGATVNSDHTATNAFDMTGMDNYLRWNASSSSLSGSEGLLKFDIYLVTSTGINSLFECRQTDSEDTMEALILNDNTIIFGIEGSNAGYVNYTSTNTVPDTTWTTVQFRWSVANDQIGIKIGDNAWEVEDAHANTVTAWASAFTTETWAIGEDVEGVAWNDVIYIDNVYMDSASGL